MTDDFILKQDARFWLSPMIPTQGAGSRRCKLGNTSHFHLDLACIVEYTALLYYPNCNPMQCQLLEGAHPEANGKGRKFSLQPPTALPGSRRQSILRWPLENL